jgi:hypothetical protein
MRLKVRRPPESSRETHATWRYAVLPVGKKGAYQGSAKGKFFLFHDEKAGHVHEHVHDNGNVNVGEHVLVDVAVDGCCLIRR